MTEFKLNNIKYTLPQSWSEVPYRQAKELLALERIENLDDLEKAAKVISILSGVDFEILSGLKATDVFSLFHQLQFLEIKPEGMVQEFKFRGETYYANSLEDEIYKSFIIYHKIENTFRDTPEEIILHKLALLCRRKGETIAHLYDADNSKLLLERVELFNDLPADVVFQVDTFFLTKSLIYAVATQAYSQALQTQQETEDRFIQAMTTNGTGKVRLTGLHKILLRFILSITKKRAKYLAGLSTK